MGLKTKSALVWHSSSNICMDWKCRRTTGTSLLPLKERNKLEKLFPSPNGRLKYISSMALEAYGTLAGALQIFLLFQLPIASREFSFSRMKKLKFCMLYEISQDLALLSAANKISAFLLLQRCCEKFSNKTSFLCSCMVLLPAC